MKLNPLSVLDENAERNAFWKFLSVSPRPRAILKQDEEIPNHPLVPLANDTTWHISIHDRAARTILQVDKM